MRRDPLRLALAVALIGACGGEISSKNDPANSGANAGPGLNSTPGPGGGMEMGSSDAEILAAWNRLGPLLCQYDATCDMPMIQDQCPIQAAGQVPEGQCWVVDNTLLSQCESQLRGLQCEGQWQNAPVDCLDGAVRQCECLDGYESVWQDDGSMRCFPPCTASNECGSGTQCYDGACTPPQADRCPVEKTAAEVNGEFGCYDQCDNGACPDGLSCRSGLCIPDDQTMGG